MWGRWIGIYIPFFKGVFLRLRLNRTGYWHVRTNPRHVRVVVAQGFEMSIIVARIIAEALVRFDHVLVA